MERLTEAKKAYYKELIMETAKNCASWMEVAEKLGWTKGKLFYWRDVFNLPDSCLGRQKATEEYLRQAIAEGKTAKAMADELGLSERTIRFYLQKYGLKVGRRNPAWLLGRDREALEQEVAEMYSAGFSAYQIARHLNIPPYWIYPVVRKFGLRPRFRARRRFRNLKEFLDAAKNWRTYADGAKDIEPTILDYWLRKALEVCPEKVNHLQRTRSWYFSARGLKAPPFPEPWQNGTSSGKIS